MSINPDAIAATISTLIGFGVGHIIGWHYGKRRGQDEQRVADILDQWKGGWRKLPPRNVEGQFTKKDGAK